MDQRQATPPETIAHPLLGASSSVSPGLNPSDPGTSPVAESSLGYKPRHRRAPASPGSSRNVSGGSTAVPSSSTSSPAPPTIGVSAPATTSTTFAVPSEPEASTSAASSAATSRLQHTSLKAAAQNVGLGNGTMGMGMIDAIFEKGARVRAEGSSDWSDLLKVLTSGKAIIMLPSTPASSLPMTPQTLRDHVAFLSPPIALTRAQSPTASVLVTLSGLIGTLRGTTVTFESTVPSDSALISSLREDSSRARVLSSLRPTELSAPSSAGFPSYTVSSDSTSLPFPPLGKGSPPPLEVKTEKKEVAPVPARRINPFASLFGTSGPTTPASSGLVSPSKAQGGLSPDRPSSPSAGSRLSSPRPSVLSLEVGDAASIYSDSQGDGYNVVAYSINKPIRYAEVHKALVKTVRSAVRQELDGLPSKVIDKVLKLVVGAVCPIGSGGGVDAALLKSHHHGLGSAEVEGNVPLDFSDPAVCGERIQDFMEGVYDDLVQHFRNESLSKSKAVPWARASSLGPDDEDGKKAATSPREAREQYVEKEAGDGTERIEGLVCRLLYNRIFSPLHSDDARHDEALSSRIAALNLLDLSLDHLGLITRPPGEEVKGEVRKGLAQLVEEVGHELQTLAAASRLTPKDKADVLVKAHQLVVEGLGRLPPIQLRPEGESYHATEDEEDEASTGLSTIAESESTPQALRAVPSTAVPDLVLSASASGNIDDKAEETLSDSVGTVIPPTEGSEPADKPKPQPTSGADLILPIIIYAVVKANPAQLASQLMYLRRYRSAICLEGEANYAIVNLTAVVEFIEHVQLAELGLGDGSDKVISVEDLSPIGLTYLDDSNADAASIASASSRLRGRVFQVGELAGSAAGSANKVITGVVDSSWSALRGFMSPANPQAPLEEEPKVPGRPRQASTFSLASVTASVASIAAAASTATAQARNRSRASSRASEWGANQELLEVASRPESIREHNIYGSDEEEEDEPRGIVPSVAPRREASIGGRLASIGAFGRVAPGPISESPTSSAPSPDSKTGFFASLTSRAGASGVPQRRPSGLGAAALEIKKSEGAASPVPSSLSLPLELEPPVDRFLTCEVADLRLGDVGTLLRDYRRLAGIINRLQAANDGHPPH
ncbi:hypothetical protein Q8F55_004019 [Vanrija albida]|uniref:VPS9 domain-containing protein n=1 Tax=Vanrija albida TaxID=181172 RepID=A0ABR3Q6D4_9TREE